MAGNDAIHANPPYDADGVYSTEHITTHGSDWLWAAFAVMLLSDLVVFAWHLTIPRGQRVFHQLAMFVLTTASIAYFCLASDLGFASIAVEFDHLNGNPVGTTRQIWYVRYIDWVITTPALLLELALASGLPLADIITLTYFDIVMIVTGLVGALVKSSYKWGLYTFGCFAEFYIWWVLVGPARSSAGALGKDFKKSFTMSAAILSFLWLLYPIAWGLADGGNVISPDSEMIFYGILDVLAKPVFVFIHLFSISKLDLSRLQLSSGKFSTSAVGVSAYDAEKAHRDHHAARDAVLGAGVVGVAEHEHHKKKGMFAKKGKYDARTDPLANPVTENPPRESTATAVA